MKPLGWLLLGGGLLALAFDRPALGSGNEDGSSSSRDVRFLREQYALLQSLPPARQQQLRNLDADLHALDKETQDRLRKVLDNYNWWLAHLLEKDRKRVTDAATAHERLKIVEELKEREWIETLPKIYRDKYAKSNQVERIHDIKVWREEQRERHEEWLFVHHNWEEIKNDRFPSEFQAPDFRPQIEVFVANLEPQLPKVERERLRNSRKLLAEEGTWFRYLAAVVDLADRFPLLPGPQDGPRYFDNLPKSIKEALEKEKAFSKKKNLPKDLNSTQRWPEFAIAVTEYARMHRITLSEPLGPINKAAMPLDVQVFVDKTLEPTLKRLERSEKGEKADQAKLDLERLRKAEGKWPDYPRAIMEIAKSHKIPVPGWTLPGKPELWDRFRTKPQRKN